jgi:hypothetical protein
MSNVFLSIIVDDDNSDCWGCDFEVSSITQRANTQNNDEPLEH